MRKSILECTPKRSIELWGYLDDKYTEVEIIETNHNLDRMGTYVWECCAGHLTVSEIIYRLVEDCDIFTSLESAEVEVLKLLEIWRSKKLIIMDFDFLHPYAEYDDSTIYKVRANVEHAVDILLLFPPSASPTTIKLAAHKSVEPLGIGYISAFLNSHGFNAGIINLWNELINPATIKDIIARYKPKIVGISSMTDNFENGLRIADIIKQFHSDMVILYGGAHVTYDDENALMNNPSIDVIVRGEGEYTILELVNLYFNGLGELSRINGISYRKDGKVIRTPNRTFIKDLDSLPFPDRTIVIKKGLSIGVQTSRGCPGECIFCSARGLSGGKYRMRSAENVIAEVESLLEKGVTHIFFQDDTLTADLRRLNKMLDLIEERGLNFEWEAESRVDVLEKAPDVIKRMAKAGCVSLQFGVESGSQTVLDALRKNITIEQIYNAVTLVTKEYISLTCTFLVGHPFETYDTMRETYEFAEKLCELGVLPLLSAVCPYPGTSIAENPEFYNVEITSYDYLNYSTLSPIINIKALNHKEIRKYYYYYFKKIFKLYTSNSKRLIVADLFMNIAKNRITPETIYNLNLMSL
ncbi:hypothetical protein FACS1894127_1860 [Clostridia bacterium]|nr:hypothetical protein FACS1894127_1860 [Clostridia bacterium]